MARAIQCWASQEIPTNLLCRVTGQGKNDIELFGTNTKRRVEYINVDIIHIKRSRTNRVSTDQSVNKLFRLLAFRNTSRCCDLEGVMKFQTPSDSRNYLFRGKVKITTFLAVLIS